jgi:hypothetical protein
VWESRVYFRITNGPSWMQASEDHPRQDRLGWMSLARWQVDSICGRIEITGTA